MGVVSLLSERSARSPTSPGRVSERQVLPLWGFGRVLPKNAESLRNSDALMRVAVPRRRGPAGLRDLFRFCRNCGLYALRSGLSACARHGWYHYPRCALCAAETPDGRLSKRLICRFLRSGGRSSPARFLFSCEYTEFSVGSSSCKRFCVMVR